MKLLNTFVITLALACTLTSGFAQTHFTARLTAAQENHAVTPDTATGTGTFVLTEQGLEYDITVEGLSGPIVAAHFHGPAGVGVDAGVIRGISDFDGNTASGTWTLAEGLDAYLTDLLTGKIYVNVHTAANGGGEIRGQVKLSSGQGFTAVLNAGQENHTVTPDTATGTASFTLTDAGLVFHITVEGLSGPIVASHFHGPAPAGQDAGVIRGITEFEGNTASGVWTFDQDLGTYLTDLMSDNIYVNIHTAANGSGEIRGQVHASNATTLTANLTASQENHTVTPDTATGTGAFVLVDTGLQFDITVEGLSGPIVAAHFHGTAADGQDAGVVHAIAEFDGNSASGIWAFNDGLDARLNDLLTGNLYVNVHTAANGSGEIRGQVNLSSGDGFRASLTAAQENHTVTPDTATGTASFTLTDAGLVFDTTVEGLSGPIVASHFHGPAPAGQDAGVIRGITEFDGNTASGVWTFSEGLDTRVDDLRTGNIYVNVHTAANGSGEIRGQINPVIVTAVEPDNNAGIPQDFSLSQNFPNPFNPSTEIRFSVTQAGVTSLKIYNMLGQEVATLVNESLQPGSYKVQFEAVNLAAGLYAYRLESRGSSQVRKMILLK